MLALLGLDPNLIWVSCGVLFVCASAGLIGVYTFLRKNSLMGDAVSHAILPGICTAFMLTGTKNPAVLMLGALVSGMFATYVVDFITQRTKVKTDAALSIVLSSFYGLGIFLLTIIQSSNMASQSGLDKFLFGKAASLLQEDIILFSSFSLVLCIVIFIFFNQFKLVIFDKDYARTKGFSVKSIETLLSVLTVCAIALGIQAVGVVLMAALLITPAAAARYWTNSLLPMLSLTVLFSVASGLAGTYVSYSYSNMPTGPWIVSFLSIIVFLSVALGLNKGWLRNQLSKRAIRSKTRRENILKVMYQLTEKNQGKEWFSFDDIVEKRFFKSILLKTTIRYLIRKGFIFENNKSEYRLTENGIVTGRRLTRIHRLWEIYLTKYFALPQDHVHEDAEAIEHIITPELERELERHLNFPTTDPHNSPIPYSS